MPQEVEHSGYRVYWFKSCLLTSVPGQPFAEGKQMIIYACPATSHSNSSLLCDLPGTVWLSFPDPNISYKSNLHRDMCTSVYVLFLPLILKHYLEHNSVLAGQLLSSCSSLCIQSQKWIHQLAININYKPQSQDDENRPLFALALVESKLD